MQKTDSALIHVESPVQTKAGECPLSLRSERSLLPVTRIFSTKSPCLRRPSVSQVSWADGLSRWSPTSCTVEFVFLPVRSWLFDPISAALLLLVWHCDGGVGVCISSVTLLAVL